jgi:excisionase family DNA binding protein
MAQGELDSLMTVTEASKELGISVRRVRQLAEAGQLAGEKIGRDWIFTSATVQAFKALDRPTGRPPKQK